jgi:hypothetical protein
MNRKESDRRSDRGSWTDRVLHGRRCWLVEMPPDAGSLIMDVMLTYGCGRHGRTALEDPKAVTSSRLDSAPPSMLSIFLGARCQSAVTGGGSHRSNAARAELAEPNIRDQSAVAGHLSRYVLTAWFAT